MLCKYPLLGGWNPVRLNLKIRRFGKIVLSLCQLEKYYQPKFLLMKKIYSLALGLLLSSIGMSASAAVTGLPIYADPESDSSFTFDEISSTRIQVIWGDGAPLYYNPDSFPYYDDVDDCLYLDLLVNGEVMDYIPAEIVSQVEGGQTKFSFLEINVSGGYAWDWIPEDYGYDFTLEVFMPEGCIFVGQDGGDVNQDMTLTYNIGEGSETPKDLPNPKFDLAYGDTLFIYWDQEIQIVDGSHTVQAQMYYPGSAGNTTAVELLGPTTWVPGMSEGSQAPCHDNALMLNLAPYVAQYGAGKYQVIVFRDGVIASADGMQLNTMFSSPSIQLETSRTPINVTSYTFTTDAVTLVYDYDVAINPDNESDILVFSLVDSNQEYRLTANDITINGNTVVIDLSSCDFVEGEHYYYELPEGFFLVGSEFVNASMEGEFAIDSSAVNAIGAGFDNAPVYNLQGVKVSENLKSLRKGLYIVNGKKVLVK